MMIDQVAYIIMNCLWYSKLTLITLKKLLVLACPINEHSCRLHGAVHTLMDSCSRPQASGKRGQLQLEMYLTTAPG